MTYRPDEIARKTFMTTLRGYDRLEVAVFLRAVAEDYEEALERARALDVSPGASGTGRSPSRVSPASLDLTLSLSGAGGVAVTVGRRTGQAAEEGGQLDQVRTLVEQINARLSALETAVNRLLALQPSGTPPGPDRAQLAE